MNRNIVATVFVILIIISAGIYLMVRSKTTTVKVLPPAPTETPSSSIVSQKTSLKNFMTMVGTKQCDFTDPDTGNTGKVYLDSGRMRGDFSSVVNDAVSYTHLINDSNLMYIWMDNQNTGFKTSLSAVEEMNGMTGSNQAVDVNKQVEYKCEDWKLDSSKFRVPSDKKFTDMSKMLKDMSKMKSTATSSATSSAAINEEACAACNSLEGQQKTQCLTALKCK